MSEMAPRTEFETPLSPQEVEADRKTESLIDVLLTARLEKDLLPDGFVERLVENRPFAPWEVNQRKFWRVPLGIGLGLFSAGMAIGLTPIFTLEPATALELTGDLLAVSTVRPLKVLMESGRLLGEASALLRGASPATPWVLGLGFLAAAGTLAGLVRLLPPLKLNHGARNH